MVLRKFPFIYNLTLSQCNTRWYGKNLNEWNDNTTKLPYLKLEIKIWLKRLKITKSKNKIRSFFSKYFFNNHNENQHRTMGSFFGNIFKVICRRKRGNEMRRGKKNWKIYRLRTVFSVPSVDLYLFVSKKRRDRRRLKCSLGNAESLKYVRTSDRRGKFWFLIA